MSSRPENPVTPGPASLEKSLQWTLGLLVLLVLLAITGAAAWIGREATLSFVASRLQHDAEAIIAGLALDRRAITKAQPPVYSQPLSGHYFVVRFGDADDDFLRSRSLWDTTLDAPALAPGATADALTDGPRGQRLLVWRGGYEKQGQDFTVAVAEDVAPVLTALRQFLWTGALLALVTASVLLWVQKRLLRRAFRSLDDVRADIRHLGRGETGRLREAVPAEVQPLVHEFNHLIGVWQLHLQRSRNAVGNLAHALKAPLHLLLQHGRENNDDSVVEQAERMRQLVERELRQARLAGAAGAGQWFAPARDVADLVATVQALHRDKPLEITTDIRAPEYLPFDQEDMLELIGNLLDNAAKWAGGRIVLTLAADTSLRIELEDDGPGVDPAAADALLARGTRLDESTPGHGLGLAIAGDIVGLYRGRIELQRSAVLGGLAVRLELPIAQTDY